MPMVQEFWKKLNANEKMVMYGAGLIIVAFLISLVDRYGYGGYGTYDVVGAIVVGVLYWLKYAPNQSIKWPAPIQTIVLVISGIAAIFALLTLLVVLAIVGSLTGIVAIVNAVGCVMMAWFAYKEYQAMPKSAAPTPPAPPAPPAA
jgi:hypothetical protein